MKRFVGCAALFVVAAAHSALATNQTASLAVNVSVSNNCTIATSPVTFASYDPVLANASANLDGTGRVTVACTKGAAPTIGLGTGANGSGNARRLKSGTNYLTYEMYKDSNYSAVWNEGAGMLTTTAATSKVAREFTVYGRVAGDQDVPAGAYSDTVTATVNF